MKGKRFFAKRRTFLLFGGLMDLLEKQMIEQNKKAMQETARINDEVLQIPEFLSDEEKTAYAEIVATLKRSIKYRLSSTDAELIWQYCQIKIMRDRAWKEYNKKPDRYIRIVTGICSDGKTPKVMVKENEHYKTLQDCNKHLEKILKDLRLTPEINEKFKN